MAALKLHFLNVGHGDSTFVELPSGRLMMIDINNTKSLPHDDEVALAAEHQLSLTEFKSAMFGKALTSWQRKSWEDHYEDLLVDPIDFYRANFDGRSIFRYIQTHPDMDHMTGLHRFFWQEKITLENFWDTANTKDVNEDDCNKSRYAYIDWLVYSILRAGQGPDESTHKALENYRDETGQYWTDDDIQVLSPTIELINAGNATNHWNDMSYVLKLTHGGRSVILPGDAEQSAWDSITDQYWQGELDCDILKAAHHGRKNGYHEEAVKEMDPEVVICSVGKKPSTDASADYARHGAKVLSTRFHGTISVTIWHDGEVWVDDRNGVRIHSLPPLSA
jgi:beta-lactamase superfamily II metal-dependent hydrolase